MVANDDVQLEIGAGEIHAVLGENGAGKSTLMKIIFGSTQPDRGEILWQGQPVRITSPQHARRLGIAMVFQHFSLFDTLTVTENIALGLPANIDMAHLAERITQTGEKYGLELEPHRHVHTLSVGERQRVEIVRALLAEPKLLILDEPTSVLTPQAVQRLFVTLRQLASEGCSILFISHKLDEIRELCTHATVMRLGRVTGTCNPREQTAASLSRMMIGAEPPKLERDVKPCEGEVALRVTRLSLPRAHIFATELKDVSLEVRAGEIVGIAGVSGNGQQELIAALSGEDTRAEPTMIELFDKAVGNQGPTVRRRLRMGFVPEERLGRGAVPVMSLAENLLLSNHMPPFVKTGLLQRNYMSDAAKHVIESFRVKARGDEAIAKSLSGGNLQKFIVGREVKREPRVLLIAQPTWGVDVGAASQIHHAILGLKERGCAVLLISEELDELFELSDRLYVMAKGRLSPSLSALSATREQVGIWMSGLWEVQALSPTQSTTATATTTAPATTTTPGIAHV